MTLQSSNKVTFIIPPKKIYLTKRVEDSLTWKGINLNYYGNYFVLCDVLNYPFENP